MAELEKLTGKKVTDLHRHFIDELRIVKDGKTYARISEVFDCWFESGAMPYAQAHYPFEAKEQFEQVFPADFVAEGLDQTRGWFYTLMVLSTALFNKPAFKNCVVNGILLGSDGKKMSKSKKNYPNIEIVFEKYGADAMRLVLLGSKATQAQEMTVSEKVMETAVKQILIPILHMYRFFGMQANQLKFLPKDSMQDFDSLSNGLDQWLVYSTEEFRKKMTNSYEKYNLVEACTQLHLYIEDISKFYIRNSKRRFKQGVGSNEDRLKSLECLHYALTTLSKCAAPLMPFMADTIYRELYGFNNSVHLQRWPQPVNVLKYAQVFNEIETVRKIIDLCNSSREQQKIRLQQPLRTLYLSDSLKERLRPFEDLLKEEVNVEKIEWTSSSAKEILDYKISLKTKILGPKYREDFSNIQRALQQGEYKLEKGNLLIASKVLTKEEFEINYIPRENVCGAQEGDLWVALDIKLTPELREKGIVRVLLHKIQMARKGAKYDSDDVVEVYFTGNIKQVVSKHESTISKSIGLNSKIIVSEDKDKQPEKFDRVEEFSFGEVTGKIQIKHVHRKKQTSLAMANSQSMDVKDVPVSKPLVEQMEGFISSWEKKLKEMLERSELSKEILVQIDAQFNAVLQIVTLSRKSAPSSLVNPTSLSGASLHQTFSLWSEGAGKRQAASTTSNEKEESAKPKGEHKKEVRLT